MGWLFLPWVVACGIVGVALIVYGVWHRRELR